jgi:poly-gamma-glutamate capsule biosynthesis protein CapA/YwtB (metallophosphatase superfamily)
MSAGADDIRLALCGDVMLGRGVDQILPYPGDPTLYSPFADNAKVYVQLAERKHGPIPAVRGFDYVWGDALSEFAAFAPDLRLINLETAITAQGKPWPKKPIQYRMNPQNIDVLTCAKIDFCALANNHVMDWGYVGMGDTMKALARAGIARAGAGRDRGRAAAPAILNVPGKGRAIVVSLTMLSGHTPERWAADAERPGVNLVDATDRGLDEVKQSVAGIKQLGDVLIASIHSGINFGHEIDPAERAFALRLIDETGFDLIHCHSSHHVKAIEMHRGRPILYGTGDVINDYEGIVKAATEDAFCPHFGTIVFATLSADTGACSGLVLRTIRMRQMRVQRADADEAAKLYAILKRESAQFGTRIENRDGLLAVDVAASG